ncbi:hypothetical protein M5D96_007444 [Drosophila gunungcola]|uniref:BESS domain-containing protein n=1 Tax=Drosophila gunungcola TaxID=103775 RepID=A0A9P9YP32_9MUSC|nr:hypothetical protein M5D96_007444 [Drosophila gunungcola]
MSSTSAPALTSSLGVATPPNMISPGSNLGGAGATSGSLGPQIHNSNSNGSATGSLNCAAVAPLSSMTPPATSGCNSAVVLPLPISPASSAAAAVSKANANALASLANHLPMGLGVGGLAQQMFPLATLKAAAVAAGLPLPPTITPPGCSSGSGPNNNVGCLIIEPHLFAAADNFKKELTAAAAAGAPLGLFQNLANQVQNANRLNGSCSGVNLPLGNPTPPPPPPAPPASKVRRVQPSPQTTAINLSCSGGNNSGQMQPQQTIQMPQIQQQQQQQQPQSPAKTRKICDPRFPSDWDVSAVLQANRELDANTLFFLSLARQVRAMPMKFQSLAKMRCMRIVSDLELELENFDCNGGAPPPDDSGGGGGAGNLKYCSIDTPPPPPQDGSVVILPPPVGPEGSTEHFVYVMSPSRVESMIDISSDEEATMNGVPCSSAGQI